MVKPLTRVTVKTYTVGNCFGTAAEIRSAATGKRLATTETRPFGFDSAAILDAAALSEKRRYQIVECNDES